MLLSDDISASFLAHPDLVSSAGSYIDAVTNLVGGFGRGIDRVFGIADCQPARENEVGGKACVGVRGVVGVRGISPSEDVGEAPGPNFGLGVCS